MTKARNLARLSSVNTSIVGNTIFLSGNVSLANATLSLGANTINSTSLTSTGVVANSYGNTTAIPVITVDAAGRITNATTSSVSGVTGLSYTAANSTVTVSTSTTNFNAVVTSGNSTVQGLLTVIDSVSNTSTLIAGSANSVTTAYLLAANAVSNATGYAATAYSNAVATAASDATTKAGTAYSNATTFATTAAGTAYSNAVSVASSDATTKAGTAYSNATTYAATIAGTAYSNAVSVAASDATTKAGTAYSNAIAYANTVAYTAAGTAYSNVFNGGTFSGAVTVQANLTANSVRMNGDLQIDGNLTVSGNSVTINVTNLNVDDNMIYLNSNSTVSHPDLGFAGNYNDGSYQHAGLFRDATDGVWKFFHGYTPEPDASAFIDTANTSFALSNLQINYVIGNVTGSANSATYLGGNTASTLRTYSDTIAGTAYSNATTYAATIAGTAYSNATAYAATIAGTAYSNAVSVAASDATTKAGTAYSNATTYAATIAGTAYSNATAFAANASNISSGTLSASRLPATYLTAESDTLATVTGRGSTTNGAITISSGTTDQGLTMTVSDAGWNYIGFSHGATRKAYFGLDASGNPQWGSDSGAFSITGNYTTIGTSARSPLFYDSDDTSYYVDPRSNSTLSGLKLNGIDNDAAGSGSDAILWINKPNDNDWAMKVTGGWNYGIELRMAATHTYAIQALANGTEYSRLGSDLFYHNASVRAPIFYDSDDTTYYVDPNSTSDSALRMRGGALFGPNTTWSASLYVGGNGRVGTSATVAVTNGNLHMDGQNGYQMYLNYYSNENIYTGTGNLAVGGTSTSHKLHVYGTGYATSDFRAPIFYDSDNTAYYTNPAGASVFSDIRGNGGNLQIIAGNVGRNTKWRQLESSTDIGISFYNSADTWCMQLYANAGTDYGFLNGNWAGWDIRKVPSGNLFLNNQSTYYINGSEIYYNRVYGTTDIRSPLYYDNNDTSYYLDPASTSVLNRIDTVRTNNWLYIDANYGHSIVGAYSATRYQGVFAMGDSYKLPADGTTTGSLYGLAWSHPNAGGAAANLDSHGLLVLINGGFGCAMSYSIKASGNVTAYSDERLKTNWRNMPENYVNRLAEVKVGIYDRIDGEKITQVGVSAQSLQKLLPEAIITAADGMDTLSVAYGNAALASAVELAKEVVNLKELSNKQQTEINELKSMINMLVNKVNKLVD